MKNTLIIILISILVIIKIAFPDNSDKKDKKEKKEKFETTDQTVQAETSYVPFIISSGSSLISICSSSCFCIIIFLLISKN
jgi:uncharacterized alpha/beta hydrolase family protein